MKHIAAIAILAAGTITTASANVFPYTTPRFRFEHFGKLDSTSQNIAREELGYTELTWNTFGLNPIENTSWAKLSDDERYAASSLGFTQGTWDCFVNHYEDYTWDELANKGVQEHYRALGWSQAHWEYTTDDVPYTEGRWWSMLTDNEKKAANGELYLFCWHIIIRYLLLLSPFL